jgi:hypothetical protein
MVAALRAGFVPVLLLPLLAGTGCGGSGGSSISVDELWGRLITAICKLEVGCGDMPDLATCQASQPVYPSDVATLKADIASGKVGYDGVKAGTCIEAFERAYGSTPALCKQSERAAIGTEGSEDCASVFTGTVPAGGACFYAEECAGGGSCEQTDPACSPAQQCCAGTCLAKPTPIPVGGACAAAFDQTCVDGAFCYMATPTSTLTCLMPSEIEGTACTSAYLCASPLFCDLDPATGMGTCRRAAATGASCNISVSFGACDDLRDYCDDATGTCKPRVVAGGTCDPQQTANCVGYTVCQGTICVARPGSGALCTGTAGPPCLGNLECSAQNTCALVPAAGACL